MGRKSYHHQPHKGRRSGLLRWGIERHHKHHKPLDASMAYKVASDVSRTLFLRLESTRPMATSQTFFSSSFPRRRPARNGNVIQTLGSAHPSIWQQVKVDQAQRANPDRCSCRHPRRGTSCMLDVPARANRKVRDSGLSNRKEACPPKFQVLLPIRPSVRESWVGSCMSTTHIPYFDAHAVQRFAPKRCKAPWCLRNSGFSRLAFEMERSACHDGLVL